jgi:hypothetical protein
VPGNPDDFVPQNDCVDGDCTGAVNLFTLQTGFKPAPLSTSLLVKSKPLTAVDQVG